MEIKMAFVGSSGGDNCWLKCDECFVRCLLEDSKSVESGGRFSLGICCCCEWRCWLSRCRGNLSQKAPAHVDLATFFEIHRHAPLGSLRNHSQMGYLHAYFVFVKRLQLEFWNFYQQNVQTKKRQTTIFFSSQIRRTHFCRWSESECDKMLETFRIWIVVVWHSSSHEQRSRFIWIVEKEWERQKQRGIQVECKADFNEMASFFNPSKSEFVNVNHENYFNVANGACGSGSNAVTSECTWRSAIPPLRVFVSSFAWQTNGVLEEISINLVT